MKFYLTDRSITSDLIIDRYIDWRILRCSAIVHIRICRNIYSWFIGYMLSIVLNHRNTCGLLCWCSNQLGKSQLGMHGYSRCISCWIIYCARKSILVTEECKKLQSFLIYQNHNNNYKIYLVIFRDVKQRQPHRLSGFGVDIAMQKQLFNQFKMKSMRPVVLALFAIYFRCNQIEMVSFFRYS